MTVAYGKTELGQIVYDLGMSKLSDRYLARKHGMPIAKLRDLRAKVKKALKPRRTAKKASPLPS